MGSGQQPVRTKREDFETVFPEIVDEITSRASKLYGLPDNALQWLRNVCVLSSVRPIASLAT